MITIAFVTFPELIERKYLEWQNKIGKRKTIDEFATLLDISRPLLTMYMNGTRKPRKENLSKFAEVLGNEVYDVLGFERPDPDLQRLTQIWNRISPKNRQRLLKQGEQLAQDKKNDEKRTAKNTT